MALLPIAVRSKVAAYKDQHAAKLSLYGVKLTERLFGAMDNRNTLADIVYGKAGRPELIGSNLHFNVAHSCDIVLCAGLQGQRIGIDIEKHTFLDIDLYRDYLTQNEWQNIQSSENGNLTLLSIWVRKEALFKAAGIGISEEMAEIDVVDGTPVLQGIQYYLLDVDVAPGYCSAIASDSPIEDVQISYVDFLAG
jgi:4'-phosphopantetheinyl transferase